MLSKFTKAALCGLWSAAFCLTVSAQTLYVPGGTSLSGVGTSSNSNVGVGTSSPAAKLSVQAANAVGLAVTSGGSSNYTGLGVGRSSTEVHLAVAGASGQWVGGTAAGDAVLRTEGGNLFFATNGGSGTPVLTLKSGNGNVGIGSIAPVFKLEVADGGSPYTAYLSGYSPALYFGPDVGVAPNTSSFTAFLALSTFNGAHDGNRGDLNFTTESRSSGNSSAINFFVALDDSGGRRLAARINRDGNVGIGTANPTHKLAVNGTIRAKEVIVDTGWSDYVFADDYRLASLSEVEAHIKTKKHLPGIPSAAEVEAGGVSLGDVQSKLLAKVEELTLHLIRMEKENALQSEQLGILSAENKALQREVSLLKSP